MEAGRVTGLVGRNGYGKSTLMRVIYGTLEPTFKSVRYNGKHVDKPYLEEGLIQYLPQFDFVTKQLRVEKMLQLYEVPYSTLTDYFPVFMHRGSARLGNLSGGEARIITTLALVAAPVKFALLDEPFTHLMPIHIEVMKSLITATAAKGKGFLITDHLYDHVVELCDSYYYLEHQTTQILTKEQLRDKPYFPPL
jgi:ABC-type multidrug transport system ATPase subunit